MPSAQVGGRPACVLLGCPSQPRALGVEKHKSGSEKGVLSSTLSTTFEKSCIDTMADFGVNQLASERDEQHRVDTIERRRM